LSEAAKPEYFVDGFLMKYSGIWPIGLDKDNLFDEQKIFIVYLMGCIPTLEDWTVQVDYKIKKQEIEDLKEIEIDQSDIDIAKLKGKSIEKLKKERLLQEKKKRLAELNKSFGIKEKVKIPEKPEGLPDYKNDDGARRKELWEMLNLKGIIKKKDGL
jgi:hypothetical protein